MIKRFCSCSPVNICNKVKSRVRKFDRYRVENVLIITEGKGGL